MDGYISPIIKSWIENNKFIFIYGPAGVGKSHLGRSFSIFATNLGKKSCVIATEEGTVTLLRSYPLGPNSETLLVTDENSLISLFLKCLLNRKYIIIDTINSLFNGDEESLNIIGLISALSRFSSVGVLALGQVREIEGKIYPAAWQAIIPWAEVIGRVGKKGRKGLITIEKPRKGLLMFEIKDGEVIWI